MAKFSFDHPSQLNMMTPDMVLKVHEAALDILENTGVQFCHNQGLEFLESKGCTVDYEKQTVRFPRALVEEAIRTAPEQFDLYNVMGEKKLELGRGHTYYGPGPGAPKMVSPDGQTRSGVNRDYQEAIEIVNRSKFIDIISPNIMPPS